MGADRRAVQLLPTNICGESSHPGHVMMMSDSIVSVTNAVVAVDAQVAVGWAAATRT